MCIGVAIKDMGSLSMYTLFRTKMELNDPPSDFLVNEYFTFPLDSQNILLTTRHRAWIILTKQEYNLFRNGQVNQAPHLFSTMRSLGFIFSNHEIQRIAEQYCKRYHFLVIPPYLFIVVPTNRCNLKCIYCQAKSEPVSAGKERDMTEEMLYKTIDFYFSIPRIGKEFHLEFQGGEPLLRFDLVKKAMDYVEKKAQALDIPCTFVICTNLTLMTDQIAAEIKERGNVELSSSLDGPKALHDSQRCDADKKGSYDQVTYWIDRLYEKYDIKVSLLPTCSRRTIGYERELVDEYLRYRNQKIYVRYVQDLGRAYEECYHEIGLSPLEYIELWKAVFEYCLEKCRNGQLTIETTARFLLQNMLIPEAHYMCIRKPCGCGISQLTVAPDGSIYGCDGARSIPMLKLGHVSDTTYDELITSEGARALRTLAAECLPLCESCPFSPYCGYCVARGINQHGSPIPKIPLDFDCQIYREMIPYLFKRLMNREDALILNQWADS